MDSVGFIGVGNMGQAILRGGLRSGVLAKERVYVFDVVDSQREFVRERYGVQAVESLSALAERVDWYLFAAKPQNVVEVLPELSRYFRLGQWFLSIAAGVRTRSLEGYLPEGTPVVRVMPNIAVSVGAAATALCGGLHARESHLTKAEALFGAVGVTIRVAESLMDTVTGLSGSGPGFVFLIIEAFADAGVQNGLSFDQAKVLAAQTMFGAAKMVLETGEHPAFLKTQVTSPGGTTAAGLAAMERRGIRAGIAEAVSAATERSREMGKGGPPL